MQNSVGDRILERVAGAAAIAPQLAALAQKAWPVRFSHVTAPAQSLLVATIALQSDNTLWVVCPTVRAQETLYESLVNWKPGALFLPEAEFAAVENILPDPEIAAERLALLSRVSRETGPHLIVATRASLGQPAPKLRALKSAALRIKRGAHQTMDELLISLASAGYERVAQVTTRGQFAVRGGILDLFSWQAQLPVRAEFFGDEIESLREFDLDTQTSVRQLQSVDLLLGSVEEQRGTVRDYIAKDHVRIVLDPEDDDEAEILISEGWLAQGDAAEDYAGAFQDSDVAEFAVGDFLLVEAKRAQFAARLAQWRAAGETVVIYFQTEGEIERFREIMDAKSGALEGVELAEGTLGRGFYFPAGKLIVLSAAELFGRSTTHGRRRLQRAEQQARNRAQIDFSELNEGDLVVHLEHGVGRFLQLMKVPAVGGGEQEVLTLEFADEAKLYVPLEQAYLVSRYVGVGKRSPTLSSLADAKWARAKNSAAASIFDYAGKMLVSPGRAGNAARPRFRPGHEMAARVRALVPVSRNTGSTHRHRRDQKRHGTRPLHGSPDLRRCRFRENRGRNSRGVQGGDGRQASRRSRAHDSAGAAAFRDLPPAHARLPGASRNAQPFPFARRAKKVLELLREGGVDIVIGTHRLISGDVVFKDLGLVVIDEEQRFGVLHKEKFKELFKLVDVLTLSATPIPRTLYLSLVGVKDMSTIETPPLNRLPVETVVCGYDERIIRDAINRELERQGQVYFLHNRVQSIEKVRDRIAELCPRARVEFGHGQMDADDLESVMARFVAGNIDVLVCTTIIESGLDIPNANTIIIDRADRFGLADLYQLRGRVGRAEHKAYAYLLLPREMMTVGAARKRINAIKQYSSLGAGFRIAMRDLEIRGAGSILGTAQSGHIVAVGFDLYCQLLKQAVAQLKGEKFKARLEVEVRLDFVATNEAEFVQSGTEHAACRHSSPRPTLATPPCASRLIVHSRKSARASSGIDCAKTGAIASASSPPRLTICSF